MFGIHDFALFVASGVLLNITPGPDTLYVAGRSAANGWRGGTVAALGIAAGCFVHILAAAFGLSALLAASATAFTTVKLAGAAYLVWTGLGMAFRPQRAASEGRAPAPAGLSRIFRQGFLTNALNPKVALFFLAFLPQFIDPSSGQKALAFLVLGCVFNCTGTAWNLAVAWASARVAGYGPTGGKGSWLGRVVGGLFVFLGVRLALSEPA